MFLGMTMMMITFKQCCGAGAGGAEIIWDLEPEPKLWSKSEPEPKINNFGSATLLLSRLRFQSRRV